jgi:hypothetical protein
MHCCICFTQGCPSPTLLTITSYCKTVVMVFVGRTCDALSSLYKFAFCFAVPTSYSQHYIGKFISVLYRALYHENVWDYGVTAPRFQSLDTG